MIRTYETGYRIRPGIEDLVLTIWSLLREILKGQDHQGQGQGHQGQGQGQGDT